VFRIKVIGEKRMRFKLILALLFGLSGCGMQSNSSLKVEEGAPILTTDDISPQELVKEVLGLKVDQLDVVCASEVKPVYEKDVLWRHVVLLNRGGIKLGDEAQSQVQSLLFIKNKGEAWRFQSGGPADISAVNEVEEVLDGGPYTEFKTFTFHLSTASHNPANYKKLIVDRVVLDGKTKISAKWVSSPTLNDQGIDIYDHLSKHTCPIFKW